MQPLVSIIIPTHNGRPWLADAIDSAVTQTYSNCEVLVVDDGSTDGTHDWLAREYGDRIRCFYKENGGLASARNFGLRYARGKYVQFLDADDLILPAKVMTHVTFLEANPDVAVAYCHCLCFFDGRSGETFDWDRRPLYRSGQVFESMLERGYLLIHMALSVREWLDRVGLFDETMSSCADRDFWLRLAWLGAEFRFLDGAPLALYRLQAHSMSQDRVNHSRQNLLLMKKIRTYVLDPVERRRLRLGRAEGYWRFAYGRALAENGWPWRGRGEMLRGLLQDRRGLKYKLAGVALGAYLGQLLPAR